MCIIGKFLNSAVKKTCETNVQNVQSGEDFWEQYSNKYHQTYICIID